MSYASQKFTIRERGRVLYLGMAQVFWDFAKLAIAWHGLNTCQTATSATERLTQLKTITVVPSNVPLSTREARKKSAKKAIFVFILSFFFS